MQSRRTDRSRARATKRATRATNKSAKKAGAAKKRPRKRPKKRAAPEAPPTEFDEWQASLTPRERRVDEVIQLMNGGAWYGASTHRALAKRWGVHPGTVEHIAAEANRTIRLQFRYDKDPEARRDALARTIRTFEMIHMRAMSSDTVGGLRVALEAQELFGRYVGIEPPKTMRMQQLDEFDGLSPEELEIVTKDGIVALRRFQQEKQKKAAAE